MDESIFEYLGEMDMDNRINELNKIRTMLHKYSPFSSEPVDCVLWVKQDGVEANDYNPNTVAPPEMELLKHSILADGYTQPIVAWSKGDSYEVVDGFHRNRVGKECVEVRERVGGYLPVAVIKGDREGRNDRIASTIRHNRARGKHKVDAMSDIVVELKRRNWSDEKICRELGMEQDEVLRLCQITGLEELFSDQEFSKAWDVEGSISPEDFEELDDDVDLYGEELDTFRKAPATDGDRILHTYDKWECYKAGFYKTTVDGMTKDECLKVYRDFLTNEIKFRAALEGVLSEWKHSCEHYLTNSSMNRIAWLGQAAACYSEKIPSTFRGGFSLLTEEQQNTANGIALEFLNKWLLDNGLEEVDMDKAYSGRQADLY